MKRLIDQFGDHLATAFNEQGILIESGPHPAHPLKLPSEVLGV